MTTRIESVSINRLAHTQDLTTAYCDIVYSNGVRLWVEQLPLVIDRNNAIILSRDSNPFLVDLLERFVPPWQPWSLRGLIGLEELTET